MDGSDQMYKGPDGVALRFFHQPSINSFHTEKVGRNVFDTALMCEVMVPGMRESTPQIEVERILCAEAGTGDGPEGRIVKRSPKYKEYETQIEAFKRQSGEGLIDGTPLKAWPQLDAGTVASLHAAGIHTVEQLANVNDTNLGHIGIGGMRLRDMAKQYLNTRQLGLPSAQMSSELASLRAEVADLEQQNADLRNTLANASRIAPTPPPPPTNTPDVFNIDDTATALDGVDGLGTPAPTEQPAFDPNSLGTGAAPLI